MLGKAVPANRDTLSAPLPTLLHLDFVKIGYFLSAAESLVFLNVEGRGEGQRHGAAWANSCF